MVQLPLYNGLFMQICNLEAGLNGVDHSQSCKALKGKPYHDEPRMLISHLTESAYLLPPTAPMISLEATINKAFPRGNLATKPPTNLEYPTPQLDNRSLVRAIWLIPPRKTTGVSKTPHVESARTAVRSSHEVRQCGLLPGAPLPVLLVPLHQLLDDRRLGTDARGHLKRQAQSLSNSTMSASTTFLF